MKTLNYLIALTFFTTSCSIKPQPIQYGKDVCHLCKMLIVDDKFGAELVTKKGVAFKFDSDECMIDYMKAEKENESAFSHIMVTDFSNPGNLIDARSAFYLHGEGIQSPMGRNLASFANEDDAIKIKAGLNTINLIHWESLKVLAK